MENEKARLVKRREFIALGSAAAIAGAAGGVSVLAAPEASSPDHLMASIGYWRGSQSLGEIAGVVANREFDRKGAAKGLTLQAPGAPGIASPDLIAAERLGQGDERFARSGARVTIQAAGAWGLAGPNACRSIDVGVDFHPYHEVPFHAWRMENFPRPQVTAATSFYVPIHRQTGLGLWLEVQPQAGGGRPLRIPLRLTTGREAGRPKLRRGIYFIALGIGATDGAGHWRRFRFRAEPGEGGSPQTERGARYRLESRGGGLAPLDPPCIMIGVELAGNGAALTA